MLSVLAEEFRSGLALPLPIVAVRMIGAALLCAAIGFEREKRDHPAGLRTNMLVGLASAVFALITLHLVAVFEGGPDTVRLDPLRLVEAVTGGVAFLAAGMIVFSRGRVKGLTTGALMWVSAATGLSAGLGLWALSALTATLALVIGYILKGVERRIRSD
jgi:putative Mg2+ transporter-C (MgtC) family protein